MRYVSGEGIFDIFFAQVFFGVGAGLFFDVLPIFFPLPLGAGSRVVFWFPAT